MLTTSGGSLWETTRPTELIAYVDIVVAVRNHVSVQVQAGRSALGQVAVLPHCLAVPANTNLG